MTSRYGIVLSLVLASTGCVNISEDRAKLAEAKVCCNKFAELPYAKLALPEMRSVKLDAASPAYIFDSGKSYFAAFEMPPWTTPYEVSIEAISIGGAFLPKVKILDSQFKIVRTLDAKYPYVSAGNIEFFVNRENESERYMIIHSSAVEGGTPGMIVNPTIVPIGTAVIQLGATERRVTVPYSPTGTIHLKVKPYAPRGVGQKAE